MCDTPEEFARERDYQAACSRHFSERSINEQALIDVVEQVNHESDNILIEDLVC